jgi:HPt (histidine-containing phosphotransfer) domain-containing protein
LGDYTIRKALEKDIPFLAEVVIAAEKGNSGTLGASHVHEICEMIEAKAKVCDFTNFKEEITMLKSALIKFEIEIVNL